MVIMNVSANQEFVFTRQIILSAAKNVLATRKVSGTRMRQVAERAGISLGTLHYYFTSKTGLLLAVLDDMQRFFEMRQAQLMTHDLDAMEKVRLFSSQQQQLLEDFPQVEEIFLDFWGQALVDEQIQEKIRTMYSAWRKDIFISVQLGVDQGIFNSSRAALAPYLLVSMMEGTALQYLLDEEQVNLEEMFQAVYQLIIHWLQGGESVPERIDPFTMDTVGRKKYPSDISDEQWEKLKGILPPAKGGGRPRSMDLREVVDALLYLAATRCPWRMLPHDFPGWQTVYAYARQWEQAGVLAKAGVLLGISLVNFKDE
jgi:AcrR family transcriptional regulator